MELVLIHFVQVRRVYFNADQNVCILMSCFVYLGIVGIPAMHALTRASDGYALLHNSFGHDELEYVEDLKYLIYSIDIPPSITNTFSEISNINTRQNQGSYNNQHSCILDLKMSPSCGPLQIVGPGSADTISSNYLSEDEPNEVDIIFPIERPLFALGATASAAHGFLTNDLPNSLMLDSSSLNCRLRLGRKDPSSTFTVLLEVDDDESCASDLYIQSICRWIECDTFGNKIYFVRVHTACLPIAEDALSFVTTMQPMATAVLLGKEAVRRSATWVLGEFHNEEKNILETDPDEVDDEEELTSLARLDIDHTIQRISRAYRLIENVPTSTSNISSFNYAFPSCLDPESFLRLLHHMRRGGALGAGALLQTAPDDRHSLRDKFLRFPLSACGK